MITRLNARPRVIGMSHLPHHHSACCHDRHHGFEYRSLCGGTARSVCLVREIATVDAVEPQSRNRSSHLRIHVLQMSILPGQYMCTRISCLVSVLTMESSPVLRPQETRSVRKYMKSHLCKAYHSVHIVRPNALQTPAVEICLRLS